MEIPKKKKKKKGLSYFQRYLKDWNAKFCFTEENLFAIRGKDSSGTVELLRGSRSYLSKKIRQMVSSHPSLTIKLVDTGEKLTEEHKMTKAADSLKPGNNDLKPTVKFSVYVQKKHTEMVDPKTLGGVDQGGDKKPPSVKKGMAESYKANDSVHVSNIKSDGTPFVQHVGRYMRPMTDKPGYHVIVKDVIGKGAPKGTTRHVIAHESKMKKVPFASYKPKA